MRAGDAHSAAAVDEADSGRLYNRKRLRLTRQNRSKRSSWQFYSTAIVAHLSQVHHSTFSSHNAQRKSSAGIIMRHFGYYPIGSATVLSRIDFVRDDHAIAVAPFFPTAPCQHCHLCSSLTIKPLDSNTSKRRRPCALPVKM